MICRGGAREEHKARPWVVVLKQDPLTPFRPVPGAGVQRHGPHHDNTTPDTLLCLCLHAMLLGPSCSVAAPRCTWQPPRAMWVCQSSCWRRRPTPTCATRWVAQGRVISIVRGGTMYARGDGCVWQMLCVTQRHSLWSSRWWCGVALAGAGGSVVCPCPDDPWATSTPVHHPA